MSPLDHHPDYTPDIVPPWPAGIRYGLLGGLIFIIYSLLGNLTGFGRPSAGIVSIMVFGLAYFVIYFGVLFWGIKGHRDEDLGGYIDLKRSIIIGVVIAVIAGIISAIFNYIYMTMIEPDMAANMVEEMTQMFEDMGVGEEIYEAEIEKIEQQMDPMAALQQGLIGAPLMGLIFSFIIGLILKKQPGEE